MERPAAVFSVILAMAGVLIQSSAKASLRSGAWLGFWATGLLTMGGAAGVAAFLGVGPVAALKV